MSKKDLEKGIQDAREIMERYKSEDNPSKALSWKLNWVEKKLLDEHFDLVTSGKKKERKPKKEKDQPSEPFSVMN